MEVWDSCFLPYILTGVGACKHTSYPVRGYRVWRRDLREESNRMLIDQRCSKNRKQASPKGGGPASLSGPS